MVLLSQNTRVIDISGKLTPKSLGPIDTSPGVKGVETLIKQAKDRACNLKSNVAALH